MVKAIEKEAVRQKAHIKRGRGTSGTKNKAEDHIYGYFNALLSVKISFRGSILRTAFP